MKLLSPMYFSDVPEATTPVGAIGFFGVFEGAITKHLYVTCAHGVRRMTGQEVRLFRASQTEELQIVRD